MTTTQECIDKKNKSFWNELCGTQLATQLGITDASPESLAKFDDFYLNFYPYLKQYLFLDEIKGKKVLEVGLGYGTVSELLARSGAEYHGLDIAANAASMVAHRLEQHGLQGDVRVGTMLDCPFGDGYFDYVFSIGCFHHTGDLNQCVRETHRILKKGGTAMIMVYNKFSERQWRAWPFLTAKNALNQYIFKGKQLTTDAQREAYDFSSSNEGAPETQFFSKKDIQSIFKSFQTVSIHRENIDDVYLGVGKYGHTFKRSDCLNSFLTRFLGLDLYVLALK